jgi:X-X-X-Leu-X-X-Gly heptad repeat protein
MIHQVSAMEQLTDEGGGRVASGTAKLGAGAAQMIGN